MKTLIICNLILYMNFVNNLSFAKKERHPGGESRKNTLFS